jgi:Serine/threonine protein kinase
MKQRFFREARAVANLHHPNIVTVYQFGQGENLYYLAMRLLEGQTLLQKLKRLRAQKKFIDTELMLSVVSDVSAALDHAHGKGVIHRDVKPSNIMIGEDKRAILMDFGLLMQAAAITRLAQRLARRAISRLSRRSLPIALCRKAIFTRLASSSTRW